jgi:tripartite-type tricarboxylate transporter receptor subunit TctC
LSKSIVTWIVRILCVVSTVCSLEFARGQGYPNRPVRIVVAGVGSTTDIAARLIAQGLSSPLGQQVVVDNRAAQISIEVVAKAAPDGYTLLVSGGTLWILPLLQKMSYDPIGDFLPVATVATAPQVLVVHPSVPVKSVKELIGLAKAKPGQLNYATAGTGATPHLAGELFKSMTGTNLVRVAYKSIGQALIDLVSGQVQVMFPSGGGMAPYIESGRVRALAVSSLEPSALFPKLPTLAASGLPGFDVSTTNGLFAPAKTPDAIIRRLNRDAAQALSSPELKSRLLNSGVEAVISTPEQFTMKIKSDMTRMAKVIKDANIQPD